MNSSLVYDNFRRVWLQRQCKMFEEKSGKDAIPPGNCSRRYQNRGCSKKFKIIRFPLRSDPLLTFTTLEEASLSYTFHKKICAPFKPIFEYQTDRFRNPLKNLKPGKGRSKGRSPPPPPIRVILGNTSPPLPDKK